MNDIEVLEELIKNEHGELLNCWDYGEEAKQAIENLLKERQSDKERIKDLEEINEAHKKENGELRERVKDLEEENAEIKQEWCCMTTCLRKDKEKLFLENKIKEKIEELKQEDLKIYDTDSEDVRIAKYEQRAVLQVLEELLKGE